jgi:hypothetical protein
MADVEASPNQTREFNFQLIENNQFFKISKPMQ